VAESVGCRAFLIDTPFIPRSSSIIVLLSVSRPFLLIAPLGIQSETCDIDQIVSGYSFGLLSWSGDEEIVPVGKKRNSISDTSY